MGNYRNSQGNYKMALDFPQAIDVGRIVKPAGRSSEKVALADIQVPLTVRCISLPSSSSLVWLGEVDAAAWSGGQVASLAQGESLGDRLF